MKLETIYNHKPTEREEVFVLFDSMALVLRFDTDIVEKMTPKLYKKLITPQDAIWDLVCLFELRNDKIKAKEYWEKLNEDLKSKYTLNA